MEPRPAPSPQAVRDQLERVLASAPFAASVRSQRFLRYVVEGSLGKGEESLKEYAIAVEVFDRASTYDPSVDATVRVEASRLRGRLRDYYDDIGRHDPIRIAMPKGGYRATFELNGSLPQISEKPELALPVAPPAASVPNSASPVSRRPLMLAGSVAFILLFLALASFGVYWNRQHREARSGPIVLAVLPFANQTGVDANKYLTEGLTDNLIRQLSELPRLRVVSRAAVDQINPQSAARELGVTVLLTGELQRNPDGKLSLSSELSNAKDGTVLKSSQYLPDESDLRPIQADIVQDVIGGLGLTLDARQSAGAQRPLTRSPSAFQDFLRAESLLQNGDEASMNAAIQLLEDAVKKDDSFAQAFTSMAAAQLLIGMYFELPVEHVELARQYSQRAIALDPTISEAHGVLGIVHLVYDWNFESAQRELASADHREDAIWKLGCSAHLLNRSGNTRHAEEDLERMLEFNPGSAMLISEMGCVNYYAGHYEDSVRYYRRALAKAPWFVMANWGLGRSLGREGKYGEALDSLKTYNKAYGIEHPLILGEMGYIQAVSGDRQSAHATIQRLEYLSRSRFVDPYFIAQIYVGLNDRDQTYAWLDKAYKIRSPFLISLATDPKWSSEQTDPRFQALWNRMTGSAHEAKNTQGSSVAPGHG